MKILGLISGSEGYGVRRAWLGLSDRFRIKGVEINFATVNEGTLANELKEKDFTVDVLLNKKLINIQSGKLKIFYLIYRIIFQVLLIPKLIKLIKKTQSDTVLFRSPMEVVLMGCVSKILGIKSYWLMPNSVSSNYPLDLNRRIYRFIFRYCNVTPIANSKYTLSTLGNVPNGKYIHLGIDPTLFIQSEEARKFYRAKLDISEENILIGVFARMTPEKGQLRMIEAIHSLGENASKIHLLLCGSGTDHIYQQEIEKKIKDYNLLDRVHLVGAVDNVIDYYSACDIVANTRLDAEPFGFSVIEAMMMGIPVLAHKLGGPGETVIDGFTGWHIKSPDKKDFIDGLNRAIDHFNTNSISKCEIRSYALSNFTSDRMVDNLILIFNENSKN